MSDILETVTIETPNGPVVINKADFDPAKHKVAGQPKPRRGRPKKVAD